MADAQHDPWAHRRGEPRVFALGWSLYLLASVTGAILWVVQGHTTTDATGPAARIVLVVIMVGMTVLWPMVRLSQVSPRVAERARSASLAAYIDMLIVFVPAQVIVWPLSLLARWPIEIAVSLVCMMGSWALLTGALVAVCTGPIGPRSAWLLGVTRTVVMLAWMALIAGPVLAWGLARPPRGETMPGWLPTASPLSAVHAITGDMLSGVVNRLSPAQWWAIATPAAVGVVGWVIASLVELRRPVAVTPVAGGISGNGRGKVGERESAAGNFEYPLEPEGPRVDNQ